jgi:hypothetical protein
VQQSRTPRKKWLLAAVKLLIVAVVLLAVWDTLAKAFRDLDQYTWSLDPWWLLTAAVLYLCCPPGSSGTAFSSSSDKMQGLGRPCGHTTSDTSASTSPARRWSSSSAPD